LVYIFYFIIWQASLPLKWRTVIALSAVEALS
jgi:hypothetical protein